MANRRSKKPQGHRKPGQSVARKQPQQAKRIPQVQAQVTEASFTEAFSGPIPHPEMLAQYEASFPGLAERIIRTVEIPLEMAQEQQQHRHGLEQKVISSDIHRSWAGMACGFLLAAMAIGGGIYLILNDKSAEGLASIIVALGTLCGVFVVTDLRRRGERKQKADNSRR